MATRIRAGIGGWTYAPWRDNFYPKGLPHARELGYASQHLGAIEINATFYRGFPRASYAQWANAVPDGFVFSLKAPRFATHRRELAKAAEPVERLIGSATALGAKLGPIVWQLAPTKQFAAEDMAGFLALLPHEADGLKIRHAIDARHASFATPAFVALARKYGVAIVYTDDDEVPPIAAATADFMYLRLRRARSEVRTGYPEVELKAWARRAETWRSGGQPDDVAHVGTKAPRKARDVFVYFINGAKERAPAAAQRFIELVG